MTTEELKNENGYLTIIFKKNEELIQLRQHLQNVSQENQKIMMELNQLKAQQAKAFDDAKVLTDENGSDTNVTDPNSEVYENGTV